MSLDVQARCTAVSTSSTSHNTMLLEHKPSGAMRYLSPSCPANKHSFASSEPMRHCGDYAAPQHFVISAKLLTVTATRLQGQGRGVGIRKCTSAKNI